MNNDCTESKDVCQIVETSKLIGDAATLLIIKALSDGPKRFGEINAYVTVVCEATLSTRLKKLQKHKIIKRTQFQTIPPKVEYELTDEASGLIEIVNEIEKFGDNFFSD